MKIGAVIKVVELAELGRAMQYSEIRSAALLCESLGFDSIWVYDHLLFRNKRGASRGVWEAWSMLSALAAVTSRVELGTLVTCTSFRHPALLAKMAHTVDEISGGRLVLGVGAGWNEPDYTAFGFPFDHRISRFEEALQIIRPLLKEGRVDFQGQYYSVRDCEIKPASPRPGGPPLMVGCGGPRMLRLAARYADLWNVGSMTIPRSMDTTLKAFRKACQAEGRDPQSLPSSALVNLAWPDLLGWDKDKKRGSLSGTTEEIAAAMAGYEERGVTGLIFDVEPSTPAGYERLARAVTLYRESQAGKRQ